MSATTAIEACIRLVNMYTNCPNDVDITARYELGALVSEPDALKSENAALRAENAELLAALTGVLSTANPWTGGNHDCTCGLLARARNRATHAPDCPWRIAVELRDRIAARGKGAT